MSENQDEQVGQRGFVATVSPAGFALGIILLLIGLVVAGDNGAGWIVFGIGAAFTLLFGFSWAYRATTDLRDAPEPEPEVVDLVVQEEPAGRETYSRSGFLTMATVGVGTAIGVAVTVPIVGFAVAPSFIGQGERSIDLGPLENFPEGEFVIAQFDYRADEAPSVNRRTAYIRNNGFIGGDVPSFTILSNRCVHLGCAVQPAGPLGDPVAYEAQSGEVVLTDVAPANFSCPCHGGAYDTEGNRTAGPPTRALDRYSFAVVESRLVLQDRFSVAEVQGTGAQALMKAYRLQPPGTHVDGPDAWMTPYSPS